MQQLLAIARLTIKAAFRFRLVTATSLLLLTIVVILPIVIKDDGTARGFTQIIITYTLSVITALLGFVTLWLACGAMARDVEDCSVQTVAVKPIPRWKIWLGKWLGIMVLNACLLTASGVAVYYLLQWRAKMLPEAEQYILNNEVLVARNAAFPKFEPIEDQVEAEYQATIAENPMTEMDRNLIREQIKQRYLLGQQYVPGGGYSRQWIVELGARRHFLQDRPLYLRFKFQTPPEHYERTVGEPPTYPGGFDVGPPGEGARIRWTGSWTSKNYHEYPLEPNLFDEEGNLSIVFANFGDLALLFPVEDGIQVLYRESGFTMNFARGLGIIFCWLSLLAALGLTAATFLSFPVAAFMSICALIVAFSGNTMARVIEEGSLSGVDHETGIAKTTVLDYVVIPFFKVAVQVVDKVRQYSPVEQLSSGRSIPWSEFSAAVFWMMGVIGGILAATGMIIFTRRELATAHNSE